MFTKLKLNSKKCNGGLFSPYPEDHHPEIHFPNVQLINDKFLVNEHNPQTQTPLLHSVMPSSLMFKSLSSMWVLPVQGPRILLWKDQELCCYRGFHLHGPGLKVCIHSILLNRCQRLRWSFNPCCNSCSKPSSQ